MRLALLFSLLLIPLVSAGLQNVDLSVSERGLVEEHVTLVFNSSEAYDITRFTSGYEPLAVISEDASSVTALDEGWLVELATPIRPGENTVSFTLILDDAVLDRGDEHVLAFAIEPVLEELTLVVRLPEGAVLSDTRPAASPQPDDIDSDGRTLSLSWHAEGPLSVIVLYEEPRGSILWAVLLAFALLAVLAAIAVVVFRRRDARSGDALRASITSDERLLVEELRSGVDTQKELVARTGWSKSKMSKVVRRLEEKGVVEKRPHMRTNRLSLTKAWR